MSNENTSRRGIYLPPELDQWFIELSKDTGVKPNQLMLDALTEYKERNTASNRKKKDIFTKKVEGIVMDVLKKHGVSMQR